MLYLKIISKENTMDAEREIKALRVLKGSEFPRLYFSVNLFGISVLGMKLIRGKTLRCIINSSKTISLAWVIDVGVRLCEKLGCLHGHKEGPIYHLDLHPDNLIIFHDHLYLIDFGKSVCGKESVRETERCGTPCFSAPELFEGGPVDACTDIYSAGCILLYMLEAVTNERDLDAWSEVRSAAMRCVRERPENRIQKADELLRILKEIEKEIFC